MDEKTIFCKTQKGLEEIGSRKNKLPFGFRTVLILIDGKSTVSEIHYKARGLAGVSKALEALEKNNYIATTDNGNNTDIKMKLIKATEELLGEKAGLVIEKVQALAPTEANIGLKLKEIERYTKLCIDEKNAKELGEKYRSILKRYAQ